MESMEVESGHVQIRQRLSVVQGVEAPQATHLQILPYATTAPMLEQLSKPSMLEAFDHVETVTQFVTEGRQFV
jgi:hypothetical protein